MKSRLYTCLQYGKNVKSTSGLTRDINTKKTLITLLSCQRSNLVPIL